MTGNQTEDQGHQAFSSAFFAALVSAVTEASGSPWQIAALPDGGAAPVENAEPVWVSLTLDGDLPGVFLLEFRKAEAALLASKCMRQPVAEFDSEHSQAMLQAIEAAAATFCSSGADKYGSFSMHAVVIAQPGADPGIMLQTAIDDSDGNRVLIAMFIASALAQAISVRSDEPSGQTVAESAAAARAKALVGGPANLALVMDVELNVTLRFGQRKLTLREVLDLTSGSVIELDRQVEEPVELLLDGKVIARGEAVVIDGNYGLRVTDVPTPISPASLS